MLAQRNAVLLALTGDSGPETWDGGGAGGAKFAGAADAYYRETAARTQTPGGAASEGTNKRRRRTLVVERRVAATAEVGDTVTFKRDGKAAAETAAIADISDPEPPAGVVLDPRVVTARLTLEDAG